LATPAQKKICRSKDAERQQKESLASNAWLQYGAIPRNRSEAVSLFKEAELLSFYDRFSSKVRPLRRNPQKGLQVLAQPAAQPAAAPSCTAAQSEAQRATPYSSTQSDTSQLTKAQKIEHIRSLITFVRLNNTLLLAEANKLDH